ncbi:hypothetical protein OC842_007363 [Tilletia horrida]|uniref:Poly(A) RNA polymerase mitochondrial-like central palm domain-containing protein n=1 Tax=Tilletia horrida TaxID=155126 RepID=A0AAN6G4C8_9BASI|nr:hypothetical protein OC842_007363 [Tilletia horrida]
MLLAANQPQAFDEVKREARRAFGPVQVTLLGSRATTLGSPDSDIDISINVQLPFDEDEYDSVKGQRHQLRRVLYQTGNHFRRLANDKRVIAIPSVRAPIVKLVTSPALGEMEVDISFAGSAWSGASSSWLIQALCQRWPAIVPLSIVLKAILNSAKYGSGASCDSAAIQSRCWPPAGSSPTVTSRQDGN